jgi:hypothetical protein
MWSCVDPGLTDVSEEHIASIFRVENPPAGNQGQHVDADKYEVVKVRKDVILYRNKVFINVGFFSDKRGPYHLCSYERTPYIHLRRHTIIIFL